MIDFSTEHWCDDSGCSGFYKDFVRSLTALISFVCKSYNIQSDRPCSDLSATACDCRLLPSAPHSVDCWVPSIECEVVNLCDAITRSHCRCCSRSEHRAFILWTKCIWLHSAITESRTQRRINKMREGIWVMRAADVWKFFVNISVSQWVCIIARCQQINSQF